jgi:cell division protein FtsL
MGLLARFFVCITFAALILYKSIDNQNDLTELQLAIPSLEKEVQDIREKNLELQYEIERFESPLHLMELARQPEYGHLKYPSINEIVILHIERTP